MAVEASIHPKFALTVEVILLQEKRKLATKIKPFTTSALFVMNAKSQLAASSSFVETRSDCAIPALIPNLQRYDKRSVICYMSYVICHTRSALPGAYISLISFRSYHFCQTTYIQKTFHAKKFHIS